MSNFLLFIQLNVLHPTQTSPASSRTTKEIPSAKIISHRLTPIQQAKLEMAKHHVDIPQPFSDLYYSSQSGNLSRGMAQGAGQFFFLIFFLFTFLSLFIYFCILLLLYTFFCIGFYLYQFFFSLYCFFFFFFCILLVCSPQHKTTSGLQLKEGRPAIDRIGPLSSEFSSKGRRETWIDGCQNLVKFC